MFSKTAQYAFRILIFMGKDDKTLYSATYIHEQTGIPYKYLTMLMTKLSKAELLTALRGRNGGFTLSRDKNKINLLDVLDAIGENRFDQCMLTCQDCDKIEHCEIHDDFQKPKEGVLNMLKSTTLDKFEEQQAEELSA